LRDVDVVHDNLLLHGVFTQAIGAHFGPIEQL